MRTIAASFFLAFLSFSVFAQVRILTAPMPMRPAPHPGFGWEAVQTPAPLLQERVLGPEIIGTTTLDGQSFASLPRRVHPNPDGTVAATWMLGISSPDFPDRGAAYNYFDGQNWGEWPLTRAEGATRTGFPCFVNFPDGREIIFSHKTTSAGWEIGQFAKNVMEDTWTEGAVPSAVPSGLVWPKAVVGGADGNTIHLIAVTLSPDFGGGIYEGIDQHLLYYRSLDGGENWDIQDFIIPGLDSMFYNRIEAEAYVIDAHDETVAIGLFTQWGDAAVFKSTDNGNTWEKTILLDFPLDKYDGNGYTSDDIPLDPNAPTDIAIFTNDEGAAILIDQNDQVHAWVGAMYVEAQLADLFYYPGMDGLMYWNESFGADSMNVIAALEDINGNGTLDIDDFGLYFTCLTSHPSVGLGADGDLYVVYSAVNETYVSSEQNQNYRNIFVIRSQDGGATWSPPFNLIYEAAFAPIFSTDFECAFPSINRDIDDRLQLFFMQDFAPGLASFGDMDPYVGNSMFFVEYNSEDFGPLSVGTQQVRSSEVLTAFPNPTNDILEIQFFSKTASSVQIEVFDLQGRPLYSQALQVPSTGLVQTQLSGILSTGLNFLRVTVDQKVLTQKIMKY